MLIADAGCRARVFRITKYTRAHWLKFAEFGSFVHFVVFVVCRKRDQRVNLLRILSFDWTLVITQQNQSSSAFMVFLRLYCC